MKWNIILAGVFFAGGLVFSPSQDDLRGTWQTKNADPCHSTIVRIEMGEGIWKGRADQPAINRFNAEIRSIRIAQDSILIDMDDQTKIMATLTNEYTMAGYLIKNDQRQEIILEKQK